MYRFLNTDDTFRALNIPIPPEALQELDRKIRKCEPTEPIISWKGYIVTGYEEDYLALKYHRVLQIKEAVFPRKSDAVIWLCRFQLKREDLCWNAKAWLISRLYEALRENELRQAAKENFQYKRISPHPTASENPEPVQESVLLLKQLGEDFDCNKETIRRYIQFGRNLDRMEEKIHGSRIRILTGELSVKMAHMPALLQVSTEELRQILANKNLRRLSPPPGYYTPTPERRSSRRKKRNIRVETGIKQMPEYDPDAPLNGLVFTIGAWNKAIARTTEQANLARATESGKYNLKQALTRLIQEAEHLRGALEETQDD